MIAEMNSFVEKFERFPGCYTVIGSMTCGIGRLEEFISFEDSASDVGSIWRALLSVAEMQSRASRSRRPRGNM